MDLEKKVRELIAYPNERNWFEFKENWYEPSALGEYISSMSNAAALEGEEYAYFVWGVTDDAHEIKGTTFDYYQDVKNVHNAQVQLASENSDIILGSSYAYDRFIPDKANYNSSNYSNTIYFDSNGSKLDYDKACEIAKYSMCDPGNTIHFTSAALCQIGKETANLLADSFNKPIKPDLKIEIPI